VNFTSYCYHLVFVLRLWTSLFSETTGLNEYKTWRGIHWVHLCKCMIFIWLRNSTWLPGPSMFMLSFLWKCLIFLVEANLLFGNWGSIYWESSWVLILTKSLKPSVNQNIFLDLATMLNFWVRWKSYICRDALNEYHVKFCIHSNQSELHYLLLSLSICP
jgi:hypothetical protein